LIYVDTDHDGWNQKGDSFANCHPLLLLSLENSPLVIP